MSLAPVIETKLSPPSPRSGVVSRQRLVERMQEPRPLTVISAPAGYGKTMLLAQYAATLERPIAWISLDASDLDPVLLLTEIATALDRVTPIDPRVFRNLLTPEPAIETEVLPLLVNSLAASEPTVLILDDVHRLGTGQGQDVLAFLCEHLPDGAQVVMAAREAPPFPLARLRARGLLLELGPSDLALSRAEARRLLELAQLTLDADASDLLYEQTEGWAAGLYLAALAALGTADPNHVIREFGGHDRNIFDFFAAELLAHQPAERLTFLLRTSVLDRFSAPLCDVVLDRADSQVVLAELERTNRFLVALDRRREWYRYHHLFRETLLAALSQWEPLLAPELHDRASRWHERHGTMAEAIDHALASRNKRRAAELIATHGRALFNNGRQATIRRWLEAFSDADLAAYPPLTSAAAWVMGLLGERQQTRHYLAILEQSSFDGPLPPFHESSTRSAVARLRATFGWDGAAQMRAEAELASRLEPVGSPAHEIAALAVGASLVLRGRPAVARGPLQQAASLGEEAANTSMFALGLLGLMELEAHRRDEAEAYIAEGLALMERLGLQSYLASGGLLALRARLDVERGDREEARTNLDAAAALLPRSRALPWWYILLATIAGRVATVLGELSLADSLLGEARRELGGYPDAGVLPSLLAEAERELQAIRGGAGVLRERLTDAELRVLELLPTHLSVDEIGRRLNLSRNTVKTHLRGIYGKLDVTSRSGAVARAQALHLIGRRGEAE